MNPRSLHRAALLLALLPLGCLVKGETLPRDAPPRVAPRPEPVFTPLETHSAAGSMAPGMANGVGEEVVLWWIEPLAATGEGDGHRLVFTRSNDSGWGPAREVVRGEDWFVNWADVPTMAVHADGTLIASWLVKADEGTYAYHALYVLSWDGGETWSDPRPLHDDDSPTEHGFVSIAREDGGRFAALWLDGRDLEGEGGAMSLRYRSIGAGGEPGDERLLDPRVCDCCPTSLVRAGRGTLFAAYRDREEEELRDVSYMVLAAEGMSLPRPVSRDGWKIDGCPVNGPALAAHELRVGIAWTTGAGGGPARVLASFLDLRSARFDPPIAVDEGSPIGRVDAAVLPNGTLAVSWLEHRGDHGAWMGRRISRDGTRGPAFELARVDTGRESGIGRLVRSGYELYFAWTEPGPPSRVRSLRVTAPDPELDSGSGSRP